MTNITSVTVTFGHGIKREEYGPVKRAEVSITAAVDEHEQGEAVLASISQLALAKVAQMLDAPKPDTALAAASEEAPADPPPARRTRGPNKPKGEVASTSETSTPVETSTGVSASTEDKWSAGAEDQPITDAELLSATSKRAGELGARDPIVKLIATFATRTEGAPFKVQEIPQAQRKDYLAKLAALTA